jgi:putative ABC transport system ATP-binding protein
MITVQHLSFAYSQQTRLTFPDFSLQRGEQLLLLGKSGSGKTTLLHLIGGLLRGYGGSLKIDGVELNQLKETELDKLRGSKIGFIFQRNHLIQALTVEQNLRLAGYLAGKAEASNRIDAILNSLDLLAFKKAHISQLSQGQAQRVAIARAVLNQPVVLLADEPTSALDDENCQRVINLLTEAARQAQAALLIATHDNRLKQVIPNFIQLN